ncbi:DUF4229 domain-containing protein [Corynebacterium halotolerans]|uniref:DUF4229 domain-containing protein n=1 Tax=Corynebacterium halotolerans TaxID=225326 RepID=UPI003CF010CF
MSTPESHDPNTPPQPDPALKKKRNLALVKYGLARLGLFVLLAVVIQGLAMLIGAPVPLVISALLALIVAFPLSMLIFPGLRAEATETVAELSRQRKAYKAWVQQELAER